MDEAERLIEAFRARAAASVTSKLDTLMDLEQLRDPRIVPFLLHLMADRREPTQVRTHVLEQLRNGYLLSGHRAPVAEAILHLVSDDSSPDLRVQAALALAEFTDINGVPATLGGLALNADESIDLRYSAFTSLQRAGPTPECVALVRQLSMDEALGPSARSLLLLWRSE
jgi:HEAT repeat protein